MSCALARSSSCRMLRDCWSVSKVWIACWMCWSHACNTNRRGSVSVICQLLSQGSGAARTVSFIFAPHLAPDHASVALHDPGKARRERVFTEENLGERFDKLKTSATPHSSQGTFYFFS